MFQYSSKEKRLLWLFLKGLSLKKTIKNKEALASLKSVYNLFSQLYIASKFRDGKLCELCDLCDSQILPSLSEHGNCDYKQRNVTYSALLMKMQALTPLHLPFMLKSLMVQSYIHILSTEAKTFNQYGAEDSLTAVRQN